MLPGRGDRREGRQVAIVVQKGVELAPCLGAPKRSPGKPRQAEAHRGGVQAVKLVVELELVTRRMGQTALIRVGEDGGKILAGRPLLASEKVEGPPA
jgi:hypothetical protein